MGHLILSVKTAKICSNPVFLTKGGYIFEIVGFLLQSKDRDMSGSLGPKNPNVTDRLSTVHLCFSLNLYFFSLCNGLFQFSHLMGGKYCPQIGEDPIKNLGFSVSDSEIKCVQEIV